MRNAEKREFGCPTLTEESWTLSWTEKSTCPTSVRSYKNKILKENEIWLSQKESGTLLGCSERTIRRKCKNGHLKYRIVSGRGGKRFEVALSSLPPKARAKYYSQNLPNPPQKKPAEETNYEMILISNAPIWQRKHALKYLQILKESAGLRGTELQQYVNDWNARQSNKDMQTSYQSILRKREIYKEYGVLGLFPDYGKNAGKTKVKDEWFEYYKKVYLVEGGPTITSAWMETFGFAKKIEPELTLETFPSYKSFMRRLYAEMPKDAVYLARNGYEKWNRKYGNFISRDLSNIRAGEVWFSDHRQLDSAVFPDSVPAEARRQIKRYLKKNKHNRPVYPWLTVWRDMKTGKWLGWFLHAEAPNSDHIMQALYIAIQRWGVPDRLYIDNGKDYRAKHFTGKRYRYRPDIQEPNITSLVKALGMDVTFSLPYNPQSKTLERDFKIFKEWLDSRMPGYRGGNNTERPKERLAADLASGAILDLPDYQEIMDFFIEEILHNYKSHGKVLQGRSRNEAWADEFEGLPHVQDDALKLLCMRISEGRRIGRNGYLDSAMGMYYWAEWMDGMKGETVYLRRDPKKYEEAWVFSVKDHTFLGKAFLVLPTPGLVKTDLDRKLVQEAIKRKNRSRKIAKEIIRDNSGMDISIAEQMENLARAVGSDFENAEPSRQAVSAYAETYRMTEMDSIMRQQEKMENSAACNSGYVPEERPKGKKYYFFECDKEKAEKNK